MPLTKTGKSIMAALKEEYGEEEGESAFFAMRNKGKIKDVDPESRTSRKRKRRPFDGMDAK